MSDLFANNRPQIEQIYPDMYVLAKFCQSDSLLLAAEEIAKIAPFRQMMTPNGHKTAVAATNCGELGWVSSLQGYQYSAVDPLTTKKWPPIPPAFADLATRAAAEVGYSNFIADACLINRYLIGTRLGSHQDKNEQDFSWPIVSVSLGLSATFQVFGEQRGGKPINYHLQDGDVMVWGGSARLAYHGVKALCADQLNPALKQRINLTFRKAG